MRETCSTLLSEPAFLHLIGYPPVLTNFCKWKNFILIPVWVKLLGAYSTLITHSSVAGHLGYCEQRWTKHSVCISVTITGAFGVTVLYFIFKSWGIVMLAGCEIDGGGWYIVIPFQSVCSPVTFGILSESMPMWAASLTLTALHLWICCFWEMDPVRMLLFNAFIQTALSISTSLSQSARTFMSAYIALENLFLLVPASKNQSPA